MINLECIIINDNVTKKSEKYPDNYFYVRQYKKNEFTEGEYELK